MAVQDVKPDLIESWKKRERKAGAPDLSVGGNLAPAYPQAQNVDNPGPQVEYIVTGLPNDGVVVRGPDGNLYYKDKSISGGEELARPVIQQLEQGIPKDEIVTPKQVVESQMRQDVIEQAGGPAAALAGPKKLEGYLYAGSYLDEAASEIAGATGASKEEVLKNARTLSRSVEGEYPVLSELFKMYGLAESMIAARFLGPAFRGAGKVLSKLPGGQKVIDPITKIADTAKGIGQAIDKAPPLARHATNVLKATTAAAGEGFVYGMGEGSGGMDDRITRGLTRARDAGLVALPLATAFPYVGRFIQSRMDDAAATKQLAEDLGVSIEASRIIYRSLKDGATLEEAVTNLQRGGESRMVADANEAAATLLDNAAASSPAARQQADTAVTGRVERESEKVLSGLDENVAPQVPRGMTTAEAAQERTKKARSEAYTEAYGSKVDASTPEGQAVIDLLETLDAEDLVDVIKSTNRQLRKSPDAKVAYDVVDGRVVFSSEPSVQFLDQLKQTLQGRADVAKRAGDMPEYMYLSELARDVKAATAGVSPGYEKAVQLGGDTIAERGAAELGEKALSKGTMLDDVISTLRNASDTEIMSARMGLRRNIQYILDDVKTAAGKSTTQEQEQMRKLLSELSSAANREKVVTIMGPENAQKFFDDLDQAKNAFELKSRISVGSGTAQRLSFKEALESEAKGGTINDVLRMDQSAIPGVRDMLTGGGEQWLQDRKEQILKEIINVLAERQGRDADLAIKYIREAAKGNISKAKASFVAAELQKATLPTAAGIVGERAMNME
jgi:hypothetical protein